jgi:hypothetical protein
MKSLLKVAVAGILFVFLSSAAAQAQPVPGMLNVQGVLRNLYGEPVTGTYDVEFRLYDTISGGAPFYTEPLVTMTLVGGVFNTYLSAPSSEFKTRTNVYLGVRLRLNGTSVWDAELPRTQVTSVAYAYQAEHAEEADVALLANDLSCSGCVSSGEVDFNYAASNSPGGPATSLSCTGCIETGHILNGTILKEDLAANIAYQTTNTMTATQFIDQNNTAYYLDPNATSNLANVNADIIRYRNSVIYSPGGADTNVGLIGEHFVTSSVNNTSAGGNLYIGAGYAGACGHVQVFGNACTGTRNFVVVGDAQANRYYDRNNTSWYVDPASTSMVNAMYFSGTASTTTGSFINVSGANKFVGGTQAFDADWTDLNDGAYKLNPNATTKFNQFQTNGVQLYGWANSGAFNGFAGIGTNGGHLYMGPNSAASDYAIMRYNSDDRIYFNLNGTSNTNRPALRTNGSYLAVSSGSGLTNNSTLGNARELLLQWNQADNSSTRTIVNGNIYSRQYWGRGSISYDCKLDPNGASSLLNLDTNLLYAAVANVPTLRAGNFQISGNTIVGPPGARGVIGSIQNGGRFSQAFIQNVYTGNGAVISMSSRDSKREINYLEGGELEGVGDILDTFKPVTYFYNDDVKPDEIVEGEDVSPLNIREVPHWGLILEEMPRFLVSNARDGWSITDSVGFLLVAAKYQQVQNRQLKRQIADLEDRVALMEQLMVDAGLIR